MMKYLITGKNGQLARAFQQELGRRTADFLAPDESAFDITDRAAILEAIRSYKPDVIINCAAYNLVDKAEQDRDKVFSVNAEGPGILAAAARKNNAVLVHFGSDYVFDGAKENGLYTEQDPVHPLNVYGESKQQGERLVQEATDRHLIFRLSWVFGEGKQNFIHKLSEWSQSNDFLKIACDEFSVPTYTHTVVHVTMQALEQGAFGLYHLTNSGYCSRYEWAQYILAQLGINKFVRPVSMDSFKLPARRPGFSAMSNEQICRRLGIRIPTWQEAVAAFIRERNISHE
jgi:dTDP-4-dehydrorhamnose reductase